MCEVNEESFECGSLISDWEEIAKKKCVPTQSQIREQLGSKLSDVFFENICSEARVLLGLEPPLIGPDTVWVNPESRTENKVSVTPVPEPVSIHLKAFTHKSVLEVGQKYIDLLENQHKKEMEDALRRQAEELEEECRRKMADANDSNAIDGSGQCKKVVATLMEHFDSCFNEMVQTAQLRMRKECQHRILEERSEIAAYMLAQLQDEIERRDLELCSEFHDILTSELNGLANRYIKQINNERKIAIQVLQDTIRKYEKELEDVKAEMKFSAVVDVCRAIAQERIECNERIKKERETSGTGKSEMLAVIDELKTQNCSLQKMASERLKRLNQWRKKVRILLTEFQKFINFALRTIPGQSEFLLSPEKLTLKKFPEDAFEFPEDYINFKKCLEDKLSLSLENEPLIEEPDIVSGKSEEEEPETFGETVECCRSYQYQNTDECALNFDYYTFKSMLVRRFASRLTKPKVQRKPRKTVCLWKRRGKEVSIDKSNEFCQMLTLVGESEKTKEVPVDCFLQKRLKVVQKLCEDDPEFVKIMFGCADK